MSDDGSENEAPARPAGAPRGVAAAAAERDGRLFDSLNEGVWERDLRTGESWYSPRYKALLGFADDELPNSVDAIRARVHPDDVPRITALYASAAERLGGSDGDVRLLTKAGDWRWFRGRVRVWPDEQGRAAILVGAIYDVHEQVLAQQALQAQRDELEARVRERTLGLEQALQQAEAERQAAERANQAKATFLAHMSHELRTPLNGVLGMTQLAEPLSASQEQRRYLELAQQSGLALLRILDDVLDFTRADAGRLELHDEPFDLAEAAAETLRSFLPQGTDKGLQVGFDYEGSITLVRGDPGRVRQIIGNLVGNAIKFTDHGHVLLKLATRALDAGLCAVDIEVRDSGVGMDEATARRVFDPFEQAEAGSARRHDGCGLGLSVVRLLAGMMGGTATVDSRPGAGSAFRVELRLPRLERQPLDALARGHPTQGRAWLLGRGGASGQRIQARLARIGWSCELFYGLDAAIDALHLRGAGEAPDCVVIGEAALTPDADLAPLCDRLPPGVPVTLLLRPDFDLAVVRSATERRNVKVLIAPMTPADLHALMRRPGGTEPAPVPSESGPANVLVVEDNPISQIIACEMVSALGMLPVIAGSGEEALTSCAATSPALVLMDIEMPGMDGLETTRALRRLQEEGSLQRFPIIALTSRTGPTDRDASLEAGMDEHLAKPIQLDLLRRVMRRWLAVG
ncbi:MAG: response regulator [Proteobacteria bacterium]|nr:response regulator [Pseudomonadota bacterium]